MNFLADVLCAVPISLYVSMELVKYTQAYFIDQDLHMWDDEAKVAGKARTSNLNEELGQVREDLCISVCQTLLGTKKTRNIRYYTCVQSLDATACVRLICTTEV